MRAPDAPNAHELASNLVNEARTAGVRHIVKQSMIGADLNADAEVMRLHRQAEQIIEESGIPLPFSEELMLYRNGNVAIHSTRYVKLIAALWNEVKNGDGLLEKEATNHDDLFDAFHSA